jgi:DNA-binding SARP family transcriptional activator/tetratricopeptide (TPR) repeat protein
MGPTEVRFGVLGPLQVQVGGAAVELASARSRVLLAALLCRPNRVVSADELVDIVWDARPPAGATTTLRSYVMRLRRTLGAAGDRIETAAMGYRLKIDLSAELDSSIFLARCAVARGLAQFGDWAGVSEAVTEALALWRGVPLSDVPAERLHREERPAWTEAHVEAGELLARAELEQGRSVAAITVLRGLVAGQPHRERPHALLMSALTAQGRRAEALEVYRELRTVLVRDLAIEPSAELRALHTEILAADTPGAARPKPARTSNRPTPQTLPQDVGDFTGRDRAAARISELLSESLKPGISQIVVIDGMGGVGKSALALHAAHQARESFVDGQLYADLRGASGRPVEPGTVLGSLLYLLGVPPEKMPAADPDRAALYRSMLADRRVLILLDDAHDTAQLTPLIPASPGSAVLVTVRHRLIGLAGSHRLSLEGLDRAESRALLSRIVGADRVEAEPEATNAVLAACADLPLAIRVAAGRLASRPQWRIQDLADRLERARHRLAELSFGEQNVQASFEIGFAGLIGPEGALGEAAQALCLLGMWNGADLCLAAIASLLGRPEPHTERLLEHLVDLHLLRSPRPGRYALHDLLRDFAAEQNRNRIDLEARCAAAARLTAWYTQSAAAINRVLRPKRDIDYSVSVDGVASVPVPDSAHLAVEWGEFEHTNLDSAVRFSHEYLLHDLTWRLAAMLWSFFAQQRHHESWIAANEVALAATRELTDARAEAITRNNLATALTTVGRVQEAMKHLEVCVELYEATGDDERAASSLSNLGIATFQAGFPDRAIAHFRRSIELSVSGDMQAYGYANLGYLFLLLERFDESIAESEVAERIHRSATGPEGSFAEVLDNLAEAHRRQGRLPKALEYMQEAIAIRRSLSDRHGLAEGLRILAELLAESGDVSGAGVARAEAEALAQSPAEESRSSQD